MVLHYRAIPVRQYNLVDIIIETADYQQTVNQPAVDIIPVFSSRAIGIKVQPQTEITGQADHILGNHIEVKVQVTGNQDRAGEVRHQIIHRNRRLVQVPPPVHLRKAATVATVVVVVKAAVVLADLVDDNKILKWSDQIL
jgi:hypothetical protein